jgi:uncharacterized protein
VEDDTDELAILAGRYAASRRNSRFALTILTSLGCNLDCPHSYEKKHPSILGDAVQAGRA